MARWSAHAFGILRHLHLACLVQRVDDLAVDVELELFGGGIADSYRRRALLSGQPLHFVLGESTFTAGAVHDLQVRGIARDRAEQPVAPLHGFFHVPRRHE